MVTFEKSLLKAPLLRLTEDMNDEKKLKGNNNNQNIMTLEMAFISYAVICKKRRLVGQNARFRARQHRAAHPAEPSVCGLERRCSEA